MSLTSGALLGAYEVLAPLGAGAMGEVYRARDTRLGREVALKILPAEFAANPDRRRRFEQEARAASALNHPNIVSVYDVGSQDGVSYIVTELVDGESLRDLVRGGAAPVRKALDIAAQIADGLAAAHAAGIVHRDLKPENVMLTGPTSGQSGRAKILDFGLARYQPPAGPSAGQEGTATMTQPGTVMGTAGYMSPEQVAGRPTDARSDIFSLGIMLYEMLTGRLAFERATAVETMSSILRDDPPALPATLPPAIHHVVLHCLEKEPSRRFQSAQDLAFDLRALSAGGSAISPASQLPVPPPRRRVLPVVTAALAVVSIYAGAALLMRPRGTNLASYRFTPLATDAEPETGPVWSPDGKSIAYVKSPPGRDDQILARSLESLVPAVIVKVGSAGSLFWSADGTHLYFLTREGVWSVGRAGGERQLVLKGFFFAAALSPDGKSLAAWQADTASPLTISSPPGAALRKYEPAPFETIPGFNPVHLRFSPDGRQILVSFPRGAGAEVWLLPFPDGSRARGKPRRLFAPALAGQDVPSVSWMPDGRHIVMGFSSISRPPQIWMGDAESGALEPLTADEGRKTAPAVSPDGKKIAYNSESVNLDVAEIPVSGEPMRPLLATSRDEYYAAWSPVAWQFAYVTNRGGRPEIWIKSTREGWERPLVTQSDFPDDENQDFQSLAFSPDGGRIAYGRRGSKRIGAIWISPAAGGTPIRLTRSAEYETGPTWSPDGNWITYFTTRGLMKIRVGGNDPPVALREDPCENSAQWSPKGDTIACGGSDSMDLLSPDGKVIRTLGHRRASVAWSKDGATLYTLGRKDGRWKLGAIEVKSGTEKMLSDLGSEVIFPFSTAYFALSLSPDGKSLATTIVNYKSDIWMLEGFEKPSGLLGRLWPFAR